MFTFMVCGSVIKTVSASGFWLCDTAWELFVVFGASYVMADSQIFEYLV